MKKFLAILFIVVMVPSFAFAKLNIDPNKIVSTQVVVEPVCIKAKDKQVTVMASSSIISECIEWGDKEYYKIFYTDEDSLDFSPNPNSQYSKIINQNTLAFYAEPQWAYDYTGKIKPVKMTTSSFAEFNNLTKSGFFENIFYSLIDSALAATSTLTSSVQYYTPPCAGTASVLIVGAGGGGGGGGSTYNAGGGGGQVIATTTAVLALQYPITVGTGGIGRDNLSGDDGGPSTAFNWIAYGGLGAKTTVNGVGGTSGSGKLGGNPNSPRSGGGGGSIGNGINADAVKGGKGGTGTTSSISGVDICYGGGGGGVQSTSSVCGGGYQGVAATANSGGGGGGNSYTPSGANGVVIIAFDSSQCSSSSNIPITTLSTSTVLFSWFTSNYLFPLEILFGSLLAVAFIKILIDLTKIIWSWYTKL